MMQRLGLRKEKVSDKVGTLRITNDGDKALIPRGHVSGQLQPNSSLFVEFLGLFFYVCLRFEEK